MVYNISLFFSIIDKQLLLLMYACRQPYNHKQECHKEAGHFCKSGSERRTWLRPLHGNVQRSCDRNICF